MKVTTNYKGQLAEKKAEVRAMELGYIPCRPSFSTRYDLILDDGKNLIRVQIKYGDGKSHNSQGAAMVKLGYQDRRKNLFTYQESEVDALIVYLPKVDRLCFLPCRFFVGKDRIHIRYAASKNHQKRGILFAEEFYW